MSQSTAILRQTEHAKAKVLMERGRHAEALTLVQVTLTRFGSHIGLLCDQAANQFELGLFQACEESTFLIRTEFAKVKEVVSKSTAFRTCVFASKLFEELGFVNEALQLIEESFSYSETLQDRHIALVQQVRLLSYYGETQKLSVLLPEIRRQSADTTQQQIALLHSLMWAEWSLYGVEQASHVWVKLNRMDLSAADRRLINRDFLEMYLLTPTMNRQDIAPAAAILGTATPLSFEQFLLDHFAEMKFNPGYIYSPDLSVIQKLRILLIEIRTTMDLQQELILRKKFLFLLSKHPVEATTQLMKLLGVLDSTPQVQITYQHGLTYAEIGKSKFEIDVHTSKLLTHLIEQGHLSLEEAAKTVWEEDYTESHYGRLRTKLNKLNERVKTEYGFTLLSITKSGITWES